MSASNRIRRRRFSAASIGRDAGAPEEPVVDDQQVGALAGCQLEQLGVRGHARGDRLHVRRPGHLQAVDAVVVEALRLEQAVELGQDLGGGGGHRATIAATRRVGYCRRVGAWRSLVARTVRVGEVPGSNPGAPISRKLLTRRCLRLRCQRDPWLARPNRPCYDQCVTKRGLLRAP